mmetsp:Transcript_50062/g.121293  ORF Transcript_50062/g.121293 Transcript_50062/m.121293 type:complete len:108 (+) Transcript_50062:912-1235(+)
MVSDAVPVSDFLLLQGSSTVLYFFCFGGQQQQQQRHFANPLRNICSSDWMVTVTHHPSISPQSTFNLDRAICQSPSPSDNIPSASPSTPPRRTSLHHALSCQHPPIE